MCLSSKTLQRCRCGSLLPPQSSFPKLSVVNLRRLGRERERWGRWEDRVLSSAIKMGNNAAVTLRIDWTFISNSVELNGVI